MALVLNTSVKKELMRDSILSWIDGSTNEGSIFIMSGARPDVDTIDSARTGLSGQVLAKWETGLEFDLIGETGIRLKQLPHVFADSTGVATWFILQSESVDGEVITGTVSIPGGGGDLIIEDINVTQGTDVAVFEFALLIQ